MRVGLSREMNVWRAHLEVGRLGSRVRVIQLIVIVFVLANVEGKRINADARSEAHLRLPSGLIVGFDNAEPMLGVRQSLSLILTDEN